MVRKINESNFNINLEKLGDGLDIQIDNYIDYLYNNVFREQDWHYSVAELKGVLAYLLNDNNFTSMIEEEMWKRMVNELSEASLK